MCGKCDKWYKMVNWFIKYFTGLQDSYLVITIGKLFIRYSSSLRIVKWLIRFIIYYIVILDC